MDNTIAERSWKTVALLKRIRELDHGDLLTYEEMDVVAKCDIRKHRWLLDSARNRALNDDGIVLAAVMGEGYRRADGDLKVAEAEKRTKRIKRAAKYTRKIHHSISSDEWEAMGNDQRIAAIAQQAQLEAVDQALSIKNRKKLEKKTDNNRPILPEWLPSVNQE